MKTKLSRLVEGLSKVQKIGVFKNTADCSYLEAEADCLVDRIQQDETSIRPLALGKTRRNKSIIGTTTFLV